MELAKLDRQVASPLIPDLIAAVGDRNGEVRSSAAHALTKLLDGEALVAALRPVFGDGDRNVLFKVRDAMAKPEFRANLTAADALMMADAFGAQIRAELPALLVLLRDRLPDDYVRVGLTRALLDSDGRSRQAAMKAVADLGASGVAALEDALAAPDAARLFVELPSRFPVWASRTIGFGQSSSVARPLSMLRISYNARTRRERPCHRGRSRMRCFPPRHPCARPLSGRSPASIFVARRIVPTLSCRAHRGQLPSTCSQSRGRPRSDRPYSGGRCTQRHSRRASQFPWLPPRGPSRKSCRNLVGNDAATLNQISERLTAIASPVRCDYGLFGIKDGFVVLARLERINADGSPYPGRQRWDQNPVMPGSLKEYLVDLFFSPPGFFRVIALAVTAEEPTETQSDAQLPLISKGAKQLPDAIAKLPLAGRQIFALVYTFERYDGAKLSLNYPSSPSGLSHLAASGILGALQGRESPGVKP